MIARYTHPEMAKVWTDRHRFQLWLKVEAAVCEELSNDGVIPRKDWNDLRKKIDQLLAKGGVDPERVSQIEDQVRHDMIAFTTAVAEQVGPLSRYIHFGLTSSDVLDSALSLQIQEAGRILMDDMDDLIKVLESKALQYRNVPTIGRSHGIFAEPTSFGLKFLGWLAEWRRNKIRLTHALEELRYGKLSGAVGVNAHWDPSFEERVLRRLDLKRELVSTQVIPRDRHADFLNVLALCGSSMERIAVELRHLQRSEVGELREGFKKGQKGSSAMPHKRNPISSENLSGCARLLRSYSQAGLENIALWHERDISHSSVERVVFPDSTQILDYGLKRLKGVLEGLVIDEYRITENLNKAGTTVFSGHFLLELVKAGVTREEAYSWMQQCALESMEGKGDFLELVETHPKIQSILSAEQIKTLGSISHQLKNVGEIYRRVLPGRSGLGPKPSSGLSSRSKKPKRSVRWDARSEKRSEKRD